jgi:hypothetical protein
MFTKEEVSEIRSVANIAQKEGVPSAQLMALSQFALNHILEELLLEIDVRAKQRKLGKMFPEALKKSMAKMTGEQPKERTKRAKFIDYVKKMISDGQENWKRR